MAYATPEIPTNNTTTASTEIQPMPPTNVIVPTDITVKQLITMNALSVSGIFLTK